MKCLFVQKFVFQYASVCDVVECGVLNHSCCSHPTADCVVWYPCLRCPARDYQMQTQLVHPKEHREYLQLCIFS